MGLLPCNPNIFRDHDFVIHNEIEPEESEHSIDNRPNTSDDPRSKTSRHSETSYDLRPCTPKDFGTSDDPRPSTSKDPGPRTPRYFGTSYDLPAITSKNFYGRSNKDSAGSTTSTSVLLSPSQMKPLPKVSRKRQTVREGRAAHITSSPYKIDLETSLDKKKKQEETIARKKVTITKKLTLDDGKTKKKKKKTPTPVDSGNSDSSCTEEVPLIDESDDEHDIDAECLFCTGLYLQIVMVNNGFNVNELETVRGEERGRGRSMNSRPFGVRDGVG
ncbi:hypothetical protein FQR65_LT15489 [Abscondita terminalis]|nr:hypothetical protein FQR65_LT15489 [Abscondita terminalis]